MDAADGGMKLRHGRRCVADRGAAKRWKMQHRVSSTPGCTAVSGTTKYAAHSSVGSQAAGGGQGTVVACSHLFNSPPRTLTAGGRASWRTRVVPQCLEAFCGTEAVCIDRGPLTRIRGLMAYNARLINTACSMGGVSWALLESITRQRLDNSQHHVNTHV